MSTTPQMTSSESFAELEALAQTLQTISALHEPSEVQNEFGKGIGRLSPIEAYVSLSRRELPGGYYKITREYLTDEARDAGADPWRDFDSLTIHSGGFLGEQIATPTPKVFNDITVAGDPVMGDKLAPYRSILIAPLFDDGEATNWAVAMHSRPNAFDADTAANFLMRGNLIGRVTRSLVIQKEVKRLNAELDAQLSQIAMIQKSLLPQRTPAVHGVDLATSYLTSTEAGGDYFDFFDMGHGRFGVMIADVSGHGAGAATVMAMLQAILHGYREPEMGPAAVLAHANRELVRKKIENIFVTAFLGVFDAERRTLTYSNAGHNRPVLRRADGMIQTIEDAASIPLGIFEETEYENASMRVAVGDTLVMYTDGITEAFAPGSRSNGGGRAQMFGAQRLVDSLVTCSGEPDCVIGHIHRALYEFTGVRTREDDQTIVAARVTK